MSFKNFAKDMMGATISKIEGAERGSDEIIFYTSNGNFKMYHLQGCCENVQVEDISGNIEDLIGSPILLADEADSDELQPGQDSSESFTWTFYKLSTIKGSVTIRWLGESNGYYSEAVDFVRVDL